MEILQAGSGPERDIALLYLAGTGAMGPELARRLPPGSCVVADKAIYFETPDPFGPQGVTRWDAMLATLQDQLGFTGRHLWLIGFSAGCWAVRAQLAAGAPASYVLAADGVHLPLGTPAPQEEQPWLEAAAAARARALVLSVSVSGTPAFKSRDTRTSARDLFGWTGCMGSYADPCIERDGFLSIYGATYGGTGNAGEHKDQINLLLPRMIDDAQLLSAPLAAAPSSSKTAKVVAGLAALAALLAWVFRRSG